MKIKIHINYHTNWGESVYIVGNIPQLGGGDCEKAVELQLAAPDSWVLDLDLPSTTPAFDFSFIIKAEGQAWRFEWGEPHRFVPGEGVSFYDLFVSWQQQPSDKPYYSSAFVDGMLARLHRDAPLKTEAGTIRFKVWAPMIQPDEVLALAGAPDELGAWNPKKPFASTTPTIPSGNATSPWPESPRPLNISS